MKSEQKRSIAYVFLVIFFGVIMGTIMSQFISMIVPPGVVKEFFLTSHAIGWGANDGNWVHSDVISFKTGLMIEIRVVSLLGMALSWYFLRYFK